MLPCVWRKERAARRISHVGCVIRPGLIVCPHSAVCEPPETTTVSDSHTNTHRIRTRFYSTDMRVHGRGMRTTWARSQLSELSSIKDDVTVNWLNWCRWWEERSQKNDVIRWRRSGGGGVAGKATSRCRNRQMYHRNGQWRIGTEIPPGHGWGRANYWPWALLGRDMYIHTHEVCICSVHVTTRTAVNIHSRRIADVVVDRGGWSGGLTPLAPRRSSVRCRLPSGAGALEQPR